MRIYFKALLKALAVSLGKFGGIFEGILKYMDEKDMRLFEDYILESLKSNKNINLKLEYLIDHLEIPSEIVKLQFRESIKNVYYILYNNKDEFFEIIEKYKNGELEKKFEIFIQKDVSSFREIVKRIEQEIEIKLTEGISDCYNSTQDLRRDAEDGGYSKKYLPSKDDILIDATKKLVENFWRKENYQFEIVKKFYNEFTKVSCRAVFKEVYEYMRILYKI